MVEPIGFIIVRTFQRVSAKQAKKLGTSQRHPVFMAVFDEENDMFSNVADALIEKSKKDHPEDFIILPYWQ